MKIGGGSAKRADSIKIFNTNDTFSAFLMYMESKPMAGKDDLIDVTILMPCLNEAKTLPYCIESANGALKELKKYGLGGEILISDNGSSDGSREVARINECGVVSCPDKGYGNAVIYGCRHAKGRYIVMGDADASYDFREGVPMVLKLREGYELCMGSRFKGNILPDAMPWKNRYIGNPVFSGILKLLYRTNISDINCGLRAFTKEAFNKMHLSCPGMELASEMVVRAAHLGLNIAEIPVTLHPDKRGRAPHLRPWEDGKRHLKFLIMHGPLWMLFFPSTILMLFSILIFAGVMLSPAYHTFGLGKIRFGDHWVILSSSFFAMGVQGMLLGMVALINRIRRKQIPVSAFLKWLYRKATFMNAILSGTFFLLAGFVIIGCIVWQWGLAGFGALYRIREMAIAATCLVVGLQLYFTGLLVIILGDMS